MAALRELYHPDAVAHSQESWPEAGPFVGRDAIMRAFDQLRTTYKDGDGPSGGVEGPCLATGCVRRGV